MRGVRFGIAIFSILHESTFHSVSWLLVERLEWIGTMKISFHFPSPFSGTDRICGLSIFSFYLRGIQQTKQTNKHFLYLGNYSQLIFLIEDNLKVILLKDKHQMGSKWLLNIYIYAHVIYYYFILYIYINAIMENVPIVPTQWSYYLNTAFNHIRDTYITRLLNSWLELASFRSHIQPLLRLSDPEISGLLFLGRWINHSSFSSLWTNLIHMYNMVLILSDYEKIGCCVVILLVFSNLELDLY